MFALDQKVEQSLYGEIPIETDVTSVESIKNALTVVKNCVESVYAIVHFAGIYTLNSLVEISESDFEKAFKINVYGVYNVNKIFFSLLKSEILI